MRKFLLLSFMLMFTFAFSDSWAQERTVSGKVTSIEDGSTLPGVNVVLKGTTSGTVTDIDGNYRISVPTDGGTLVFSFIGLATEEIQIGTRSVIDLQMTQDVTQLSEVVVSALGFEVDADKLGQASSSIGGNALVGSGETNILNGMQGKAAGINITSGSGDPGAGSRIVIRGATSILGNLEPLIVIDGMPMFNDQSYGTGSSSVAGVTQQSRLNDINPDDIASMEVLKGASAAALWGSRGANGVIVITTKKGKSARNDWSIDFTSRATLDKLNKEVDLQYDYGQGAFGVYNRGDAGDPFFGSSMSFSWGDRISDRSGGADAVITDPNAPGYLGYFEAEDGTRYYAIPRGEYGVPGFGLNEGTNVHGGKNDRSTFNPHDKIFQDGYTYFNSIGISKSSESGSVYLSFSNSNQQGIVQANSNYIRNTAKINATQNINDWISVGGSASYARITSDRIQMGSNTSGIMLGGLRNPADFNIDDYSGTYYDPSGVPFTDRQRAYRNPLGRRTTSSYDNPLWTIENNLSTTAVDRFMGKVETDISPTDWLTITGRVGVDTYTDTRDDVIDPRAATLPGGFYSKEIITNRQINADLIARANFKLTDDINANFLIGTNWNERYFSNAGASITNFINTASPPDLGNSPATARSTIGSESLRRNRGYYITSTFGFFDQVYLNAGGRLDYSSTLPIGDNGFFYPSVDVAWQFSKMLGVTPNSPFSFGKLRVSYGKVGREPSAYSTQTFFVNASYTDGWGAVIDAAQYGGGFRQSLQAGNPNIKPEIKTEVEFGVDMRFLKDKLSFSGTYYSNTTDDLIVPRELPSSSGFSQTVANTAKIENKGIEIELEGQIISTGDFKASVYGNWFRNRNEVVEIEGTTEISLNGFQGSTSSAVVGEQLGVLYGDRWDRDEDTGDLILDASGFPQLAGTPGVLGDPNPDWKAGIGTRLAYKGFSLNVLFEHSQGGDIWNGTKGALAYFGRAGYTNHTTTLTAAQANTLLDYEGLTAANAYAGYANSDGTYTIRGYVKDFGGGEVLIDETYYWSGPGSGFTGPSEQFIEDATWTRLRELTLSYNFGGLDALTKVGIKKASLSLTGRNLFIWTDYTGIDPDTNLSGASNGFGLDYFNNPSTRSYIVTLNVTF
ncbi:MAG TPA: SusC/RagA family TonB-linked outer membrane protein [Fulvivirga sp.]|nr:SusC/RagA family TonB-linked outer membrane protein [Fulvivirga sp.]